MRSELVKPFLNYGYSKLKNIWVVVVVVVLGISMLVGFQWNLQKEVNRDLNEIRSLIAERQETIAPLFGANHIALRKHFILDQIRQADSPFVLFVGDSIIEGMNLYQIANKQVINAGLGGG